MPLGVLPPKAGPPVFPRGFEEGVSGHASCSRPSLMHRGRLAYRRELRLYHADVVPTVPSAIHSLAGPDEGLPTGTEVLHARSRFRSVLDPARYATYSVREVEAEDGRPVLSPVEAWIGEHHLSVVREFRRVPLQASALGLALFTAHPARAAAVVAALASFGEEAVSLYQPSYLLLAHSWEVPWVSVMLMGVQEEAALLAAIPTAFSLDRLLPELRPMLASAPEWYCYDPEREPTDLSTAVSPNAV
jgi:hypothetical protein